MSSEGVQLWRTTPVRAPHTGGDADFGGRYVFPSARQALNAVIGGRGLGRLSYVGIPDFASHCVIDFVSRRATAVPIRFLAPANAGAVVIYDQWGWQRPAASRLQVQQRFPGAPIIWDRVDSLPADFEAAARADGQPGFLQLFSLSKTLGAGGGGLVWEEDRGWMDASLAADDGFAEALEAWIEQTPYATPEHRADIDRFFRNELTGWSPALRRWLRRSSLTAAARQEALERRQRLELCLERLDLELPVWMLATRAGAHPVPGILPVRLRTLDPALLHDLRTSVGLDLTFYHFDFSPEYLDPAWVKVLPVPLHSEVSAGQLEQLCDRLRGSDLLAEYE